MILVLHGPNTYSSRKKLGELLTTFREKNGSALAVERFDAEEGSMQELRGALMSGSLFQEKKLVIVERLFSPNSSDPGALRADVGSIASSKTSFIIFWDAEIDKKKEKIFREIVGHAAKVQEFKTPTATDAARFVAWYSAGNAIRTSADYRSSLLKKFGGDFWGLAHELDKAALSADPVVASLLPKEGRVFSFVDALFEGRAEATRLFYGLRETGIDDFYVWGTVAGASRVMVSLANVGGSKEERARIERGLKLQPFVIKKTLQRVGRFTTEDLNEIHRAIYDWDLRVKSAGASIEDAVLFLSGMVQGKLRREHLKRETSRMADTSRTV